MRVHRRLKLGCFCLLIIAGTAGIAVASPVCVGRRARVHAQVAAQNSASALVVTPFAVPVAVPVATLALPVTSYQYQPQAALYQPQVAQAPACAPCAPAVEVGSQLETQRQEIQALSTVDAPSILQQRCAACHTGEAPKGKRAFFDEEGSLLAKLPRQKIVARIESGQMPPNGPRLNEVELEQIRAWAQPSPELEY